jgi:hypothetical protein
MGEPQISVRWASDPRDVSAALALREQVFCGEQGVPPSVEIDRLDEQAMHVVALAPDEPGAIGTLRLLLLDDEVKLGPASPSSPSRSRTPASTTSGWVFGWWRSPRTDEISDARRSYLRTHEQED